MSEDDGPTLLPSGDALPPDPQRDLPPGRPPSRWTRWAFIALTVVVVGAGAALVGRLLLLVIGIGVGLPSGAP